MKKLVVEKEKLENNLKVIREKMCSINKDAKLIVVVKDNGMGLDLVKYSKFLEENKVDILATAVTEEAIEIKDAGIKTEVLMLTPVVEKDELRELIKRDVTLTVGSLYQANVIKEVLVELNKEKVNAHVKVDTGFARFGFMPNEVDSVLKLYKEYDFLNLTGIFTHFSNAVDEKWTKKQFEKFNQVMDKLKEEGLNLGLRHCAATTACMKYPEMILDAARVGSAVQGRSLANCEGLKKVGTFKTAVIATKVLPKGHNISYGNAYTTKKEMKIAVIPVGYMDGFNRNKERDDFRFVNNIIAILSDIKKLFKDNSLKVVINGKVYKIKGRLGMYHSIIDITGTTDIIEGTEVEIPAVRPFLTNDKIRREYV